MATEIDICNLALGHLGDSATVVSISPPEGSAQAEHCSRFYPIARDSLLEVHLWNFAARRVRAADIAGDWPGWLYAYAVPADCLRLVAVVPADALDAVAQPYVVEQLPSGAANVVLTNTASAVLRYSARVADTAMFSPLFVLSLSWHLAAMLAGPVIKGDAGAAEAKRCTQMMANYLGQAAGADANQRSIRREHVVPWTAGR